MAWERLALIHAAAEGDVALQKIAVVLGLTTNETTPIPEPNKKTGEIGEGNGDHTVDQSDQAVSTTPKLSAQFVYVDRIQQIPSQAQQQDASYQYLADPSLALTEGTAPQGTYQFELPRPWFRMSQLLPLLHQSLGQMKASQHIDYNRVVRKLSQGQSIRRWPRSRKLLWPKSLLIMVDPRKSLEPYWSDFAFLITQLKQLLGNEAVTSIRFDEKSFDESRLYATSWPSRPEDRWYRWQIPETKVPILLLTDFGVIESHPAARFRWQQLISKLRNYAAPILTLSPAAHSPQLHWLCSLAKPTPLNDQVRLKRHANRQGFHLSGRNVAASPQSTLKEILAWLSLLPIIDSGLLRKLRMAMQWGGSELEGIIWNHPDVYRTGLGIRLNESTTVAYQQDYYQHFANSGKAEVFWNLVNEHHRGAYQGLKMLEALNRGIADRCYDQAVQDAQHYFQRLCATTKQVGTDSTQHMVLRRQCQTVLNSLPQNVYLSSHPDIQNIAYGLYALTHWDELQAGCLPEGAKPGFDPSRLQWIMNAEQRHDIVQWQVIQTDAQGQFLCRQYRGDVQQSRVPVVTLDSHSFFTPYSSVETTDNSVPNAVKDGQIFSPQAATTITLQTTLHRVELRTMAKPSWALRIKASRSGLAVELPVWQGKSAIAPWQPGSGSTPGRWQIPEPLGLDGWGLYADLAVEELIQRFRWIVPGTFLMGSPESELERSENETQHPVTLTQGFWLADSACTQALWQGVMGENPAYFHDLLDQPVEQVSWEDAQHFIQALNERLPDLQARLPTEAEWEYACRAGTTTPFSFGETITPKQVNYDGNYPYVGTEKGLVRGKTVAVKSLPSNPWGLYEMHGNVWEWCTDWYGDYPTAAVVDPSGPLAGQNRVLRGGSWISYAWRTRSANRRRDEPVNRVSFGFRLALGPAGV